MQCSAIGLGYLWQNAGDTGIGTMCRIVETRCNDMQRQRRLGGIREKKSQGAGTLLGKIGVYRLLQGERKKQHSGAQVGNLVIERIESSLGRRERDLSIVEIDKNRKVERGTEQQVATCARGSSTERHDDW